MNVRIDNLSISDLPVMIELEHQAWSDDTQATVAQLEERFHTFPAGMFGAFFGNELIGMATCQRLALIDFSHLPTWRQLTADGWIRYTHVPNGPCLHCVSICVHPRFRRRRVALQLNEARVALARRLRAAQVFTDTRLSGLASFLSAGVERQPDNYVAAVLANRLTEPVVKMYLDLGFRPVGLVPDCMRSDRESAGFGLAMLKVFEA